jgi:hypothetical protein
MDYEKDMWICVILDGDRDVHNDDASECCMGSYFDCFVFAYRVSSLLLLLSENGQ